MCDWTIREKLILSSAVAREGNQNWSFVCRALRQLDQTQRPASWFTPKTCAAQYQILCDQTQTPKRKFNKTGESQTMAEIISHELTQIRLLQLERLLEEHQKKYLKIKRGLEAVESNSLSEVDMLEMIRSIHEEQMKAGIEPTTDLHKIFSQSDESVENLSKVSSGGLLAKVENPENMDQSSSSAQIKIENESDHAVVGSSSNPLSNQLKEEMTNHCDLQIKEELEESASNEVTAMNKINVLVKGECTDIATEEKTTVTNKVEKAYVDGELDVTDPNISLSNSQGKVQNENESLCDTSPVISSTKAPSTFSPIRTASAISPACTVSAALPVKSALAPSPVKGTSVSPFKTLSSVSPVKSTFSPIRTSLSNASPLKIMPTAFLAKTAGKDIGADIAGPTRSQAKLQSAAKLKLDIDLATGQQLSEGSKLFSPKSRVSSPQSSKVDSVSPSLAGKVEHQYQQSDDSTSVPSSQEKSELSTSEKTREIEKWMERTAKATTPVSVGRQSRCGRKVDISSPTRQSNKVSDDDKSSFLEDDDLGSPASSLSEYDKRPEGRRLSRRSEKLLEAIEPGTPKVESIPSSPVSFASDTDEEKVGRQWRKSIMPFWKNIANHRYSSDFMYPVTDRNAPGYKSVVFRPMDLTTVKRNVENGVIRSTLEFQRDVMLIFTNALMYNTKGQTYYAMAEEMYEYALEQLQMLLSTQKIQKGTPKSVRSTRRSDVVEEESTRKRKSDYSETSKLGKKKK